MQLRSIVPWLSIILHYLCQRRIQLLFIESFSNCIAILWNSVLNDEPHNFRDLAVLPLLIFVIQQQSSRSESRSRCKRSKTQQPHTVGGSQPTSSSTSPVALDHAKNDETNNTSPSQGNQSVCDKPLDYTNLRALPDFSSFQKPAACEGSATYEGTDKVPIPRIGKCSAVVATSPEKTEKCSTKYKCILPKPELCDIVAYNPQTAPAAASVETGSQDERKKQKRKKTSTGPGEYTKGTGFHF